MEFSYGSATPLVPLMLLGFPLLSVVLFLLLPGRKAVLWSVLIAALFLPEGAYGMRGLPDYSKYSALSVVLIVATVFDGGRPFRIRPSWLDIPMLVWVGGRFFTSIANGLGAYDGLSSVVNSLVLFGLPYWLGRAYFSDRDGLRDLAKGIVWGGILYLPLCWFELRFSPQLHDTIYGFRTVPFFMVMRYGGYRPLVFMDSSLQVAMWMSAATVVTWWLAHSGALKRVFGLPAKWVAYALLVTLIACKAKGAMALAFVGIGLFYAFRLGKRSLPLTLLVVLVGAYPALRGAGVLPAETIKSVAALAFDEERVNSLGVRLRSEDIYIDHTAKRPILGWGGFGRGDIGVDGVRAIPDGLWVIALSRTGWSSVAALVLLYLLPALILVWRYRAAHFTHQDFVPVAATTVLVVLYWIDCLSNAMVTPVLVVALGGVHGWFAVRRPAIEPAEPVLAVDASAPLAPAIGRASLARALKQRGRAAPRSAS